MCTDCTYCTYYCAFGLCCCLFPYRKLESFPVLSRDRILQWNLLRHVWSLRHQLAPVRVMLQMRGYKVHGLHAYVLNVFLIGSCLLFLSQKVTSLWDRSGFNNLEHTKANKAATAAVVACPSWTEDGNNGPEICLLFWFFLDQPARGLYTQYVDLNLCSKTEARKVGNPSQTAAVAACDKKQKVFSVFSTTASGEEKRRKRKDLVGDPMHNVKLTCSLFYPLFPPSYCVPGTRIPSCLKFSFGL